MLQFILSDKVILVEGATEFLLIPKIFEKIYNKKIEDEGIAVIDCGGIKYKRFEDIAKQMNKTVAVLTDNDKKQSNLDFRKNYNEKSSKMVNKKGCIRCEYLLRLYERQQTEDIEQFAQ